MNRHFVLPVCFAAAAHGALLFGFTKHPRLLTTPAAKVFYTPMVLNETEAEAPTPIDKDQSESAPKAPDLPRPFRSPEPLVTVDLTGGPTMERPMIQPPGVPDMRVMLDPPAGVAGGDGKSPWSKDIMSSTQLDNSPRTRFQAAPMYPFEAKRAGMSGEVHVDFVVDERGRVVEPRVVQSSNRIFDEPTLRAVAKWQFEPGRRHGKVVTFRMRVPVVFNLNEGS